MKRILFVLLLSVYIVGAVTAAALSPFKVVTMLGAAHLQRLRSPLKPKAPL